ncbi:MAG TPA: nicotinate phosphoribosyltransferase, partial [Burkholderiaceae bacterium]|nr:nicotinate phosphoribosyltransferase [Burkholderiaceae bacterium]
GNGEIEILVQGPWLHTILFEVPLLAIVNEIYFRARQPVPDFAEGRRRLQHKMRMIADNPELAGCQIADYGTRRRFSRIWHEEVIATLKQQFSANFAGTSNVLSAWQHGLTPLGTMAHEYLQACQALGPRLRDSQTYGFEVWAREYRGDLGIALSDIYGLDAFLRDFDLYFCKLFDGARHDSGDPFEWGERLIAHYQSHRIDPSRKTLVFSDSLDFERVVALYLRFRGRAQMAFGVGTNLTNDLGSEPLQIVIKMIRCNGQPVAKLSDNPAKDMCDDRAYVAYLRQVFAIKPR